MVGWQRFLKKECRSLQALELCSDESNNVGVYLVGYLLPTTHTTVPAPSSGNFILMNAYFVRKA